MRLSGSKPITCRLLDNVLEAKMEEKGFRFCNSSIQ